MLWISKEDTTKPFLMIDGTCLTPLCRHFYLPFVQHMDRINHVCLMLKSLFQLPFYVVWLVHRPYLPIV